MTRPSHPAQSPATPPTPRRQARAIGIALSALALSLSFGSAQAATKYPVVLVHGMSGFATIGDVDYFYGIPRALQDAGHTVYLPTVSAFNSTEARGEQLLQQVREIVAVSGAEKVNLIGHSHGGPTARYVASVAPELVASVTSVGSPHRGSEVADKILANRTDDSIFAKIGAALVNELGKLIGLVSDKPAYEEDSSAGLHSLSTVGSTAFNARFPQGLGTTPCSDGPEVVNGIRYYSWTGNAYMTNILDLSDGMAIFQPFFNGQPADGLVSVCSSKLGKQIGVYHQNHLDEVNQLIGLVDWSQVSPVTLYREHAERLQQAGL